MMWVSIDLNVGTSTLLHRFDDSLEGIPCHKFESKYVSFLYSSQKCSSKKEHFYSISHISNQISVLPSGVFKHFSPRNPHLGASSGTVVTPFGHSVVIL